MIKAIRSLAVTVIALITFLLIAHSIVWDVQTWECQCVNAECGWCALSDEQEWAAYHAEAMAEYADEFTALFNGYETKVAKNGRMMIRTGNAGPYKFARKA